LAPNRPKDHVYFVRFDALGALDKGQDSRHFV
jgi:hypothetical protein